MYVIDNARARRMTKVHADVESSRAIYFAEHRLGSFRQVHQLVRGFFRRSVQVTYMLVWNYKQVATDVGVAVENDETTRSTMHNKIRLVVVEVSMQFAKNAAFGF